jgi:PAS domain S-box-containing protein
LAQRVSQPNVARPDGADDGTLAEEDARAMASFRSAARVGSAVAMAVGFFVAIGWLFDVPMWRRFPGSTASMKANTAIAMGLAGLGLFQRVDVKRIRIRARIGVACAVSVLAMGALTLIENLMPLDLGVDELIFRDNLGESGAPGRMAPATAACLALTGLAILCLDARPGWRVPPTHWVAGPVLLLSMVALLGHVYGIRSLYVVGSFAAVAPHTAFALAVLGIALLLARPERGFMTIVSSNTVGARAGRRLLPALVVIPIAIGWLCLLGQRAGLYGTEFGLTIVTTTTILIFVALGLWSIRNTNRYENARVRLHRDAATQEARLRAADHFRSFVEQIPLGVTVLHAGRIAYINPAMARMLGYDDVSALVGSSAADHFPPEDRAAGAVRGKAATAEPAHLRRTRCLRRDGAPLVLESTALPFEFEGVPSVISASRDVTDEINAERARREATEALETFRLMVESISDYAIYQLDAEGRVTTWNAGARAIKGYEAAEIVGQHLSTFYQDEDRPNAERGLEIASFIGRFEEEGWRVRKDGSRFWASVVITALRVRHAGVSGFVKVTRDLSERKQAEDVMGAALAEKTAMLQEIHHRVKNNLQMISSLLNLQARQIQDRDARAIFLDTQSRVRSIALLHESLYQSDDLGRVDMHQYVDKLVSTLWRMYGGAGPRARFMAEVDPIYLSVDVAVPCGLIVNELVTNSLKHAFVNTPDAAHNEIRIEMRRLAHELRISVADNGLGLASTVDPNTDETMGLTLVRDLTLQLRGRVEFVNTNGARCEMTFPAPASSEARS